MMAVAEAVAVGVATEVTTAVAGAVIGATLHGVSVVAVSCCPAAIITASSAVTTWAAPTSVIMWVWVSESTSTVSLLYWAEATAAGVRISKRSPSASGVVTS